MKRWATIIATLAFLSCQTSPPVAETDRSRGYDKPIGVVFDAAKVALATLNAEVIQSDSQGGILVGKRHLGGEMLSAVMLGKESAIFATYRLNFYQGEIGTKVSLRIIAAYQDGSHASEFGKAGYDQFWAEMNKNLLP